MDGMHAVSPPRRAWRVSANPRGVFAFRVRGNGPIWRWDDPFDAYGVLYMAEAPRAAYVEFFGDLRPAPGMKEASQTVKQDGAGMPETTIKTGEVSAASLEKLRIGEATLEDGSIADVTASQSVQTLRAAIWGQLKTAGLDDLSTAIIQGRDYRITQAISHLLYTQDEGYAGIRCPSYYGTDLVCWTFFQGSSPQLNLRIAASSLSLNIVSSQDPDLLGALDTLRICIV